MAQFDKCKILEAAHGYLAVGDEHWTKDHLLEYRDTYYNDEADIIAFVKEDPNFSAPVCLLGSVVVACAQLDVDIVNEYDVEYTDFQQEFSAWIDANDYGSSVTDFNDDEDTVWEDVVTVLNKFRDEVCK